MTDVHRINEQFLSYDSADGEICNIGSTDNIDIRTVVETNRDEIKPGLVIVYDDPREDNADYSHIDVSEASYLPGYKQTVDIREGVRQFIDWYWDKEGVVRPARA